MVCDQKPWLKSYIEQNNKYRTEASLRKDVFGENRMKDMNNYFYGKTAENVRNRTNVGVKQDDAQAKKHISKPTFKRSEVLNKELLLIESTIKSIRLNKPIYVAAAVLDLAKLRMYEFHYDVMKRFYDQKDQLSIIYSDTDSFIYHVKTLDVYQDMLQPTLVNEFDFSSYPENCIQYSDVHDFSRIRVQNMKVMGKFKNELKDLIIDEACALGPKSYSYTVQVPVSSKPLKDTQLFKIIKNPPFPDTKIYMKIVAKGVREYIQQNHLMRGESTKIVVRQTQIKSKKHCISTQSIRKIALSICDTKRFYIDPVNSLPFGHYRTYFEHLGQASGQACL